MVGTWLISALALLAKSNSMAATDADRKPPKSSPWLSHYEIC